MQPLPSPGHPGFGSNGAESQNRGITEGLGLAGTSAGPLVQEQRLPRLLWSSSLLGLGGGCMGVCWLFLLLIRAQRVNSAAELVEPHSEDMQSRTEASPPSPPRPSSTSRSPAPEPSRFFNQRDESPLPAPGPPPALAREVEKAPSY